VNRILGSSMVVAMASLLAVATPCTAAADPAGGCRFASAQEISGPAGVSVTDEVDRGPSRCTYNNGEGTATAKTFVQVDTFDAMDFDRDVARMAGNADVADVSDLGVEAKYLTFQHQGLRTASLMVKADATHAFAVEIFPTADRANEISVASLLLTRVPRW
jgi:hypothetical protein